MSELKQPYALTAPEAYEPPPPADDFEYELLIGHNRADGKFKTDQQLRMEYIQRTDKLIYSMTHGVEVKNKETGEIEKKVPDIVVWLDKSARPLAWLTKELWPQMAADPNTGKVADMPDFKFVNIDREQWVNKVDPGGSGYMDINEVDTSIVRSLRSIFISPEDKKDGLTEKIDTVESELDNKTILIIDEVFTSGRTLQIAERFFERAFPGSQIAGEYWMQGIHRRPDGSQTNRDLPVWYKEKDRTGRGIDDRDDRLSGQSKNTTQRLGAWFLSRRFPEPDQDALKLRKEFKQLAHNPDVPVLASYSRPDYIARITKLNGDAPFEEILAKSNEIKKQRN